MSMGPWARAGTKKFPHKAEVKTSLPPCLISILTIGPDGRKESTYPEDRWTAAQIAYLAESVKFWKSNDLSLSLILRMGQDTVVLDEMLRK
jgi:hypothetical protein